MPYGNHRSGRNRGRVAAAYPTPLALPRPRHATPRNPAPRSSHEIEVPIYELDLFLPFSIVEDEPADPNARDDRSSTRRLHDWSSTIRAAGWEELGGSFPNGPTEYAEWLFFHPFIRDFLYDSKQDRRKARSGGTDSTDGGKSLRILRRRDLDGATLEVVYGYVKEPKTVSLAFRAVELHLFDTGVGIAVFRLRFDAVGTEGHSLRLLQILDVQDYLRRTYAPYFDFPPTEARTTAGHCPIRVTLRDAKQNVVISSGYGHHYDSDASDHPGRKAYNAQIERVREDCEAPTADVWKHLLAPLVPEVADVQAVAGKLRFEHLCDDRMPTASYLAVDDPRTISDADWLRLAVVDDGGDWDKLPYSPRFTGANPVAPFAYDRFWAMPDDPSANPKYQSTRWLACGYGFTAVGPAKDPWFFTHDRSGALAHFRHHYFKLNLIAQFHRASLLHFKKRLAKAVERMQQDGGAEDERFDVFRKDLEIVQFDLLAFRNMYWFEEISGQIQAQELFDLQSRHLRTRELFRAVFDEAEKAAACVVAEDERWKVQQDRERADRDRASLEQDRIQTKQSARLGVLAATFLVVAPLTEVLFKDLAWPFGQLGAALFLIFSLVGALASTDDFDRMFRRWSGLPPDQSATDDDVARGIAQRRIGKTVIGILALILAAGFAIAAAAWPR